MYFPVGELVRESPEVTSTFSTTNLRCAGNSNTGLIRSHNEDRIHIDPERGIFVVIDGVGGQAAGEKAAEIALSRIRSRLERQTGSADERIREAITVANNEIFRAAQANPDLAGMACVLTVALLDDGAAVVGHVGDSRLYKIRAGQMTKITRDHSPVGELEDNRDISEDAAMRHPRRNEIYRDVGSGEHTPEDSGFLEVTRIDFEPDSALVLSSDGLTDQVTSAEILRIVLQDAGNPQAAVDELIAAANRAGGKDNVSVVIVEGPSFTVQKPEPARTHAAGPLASRPAMTIYGLIAGVLLMTLWNHHPRPAAKVTAAPRVLVVGASPGAQFQSIGDALAQARPGDRIELLAGEYREQVRLREGVNVAGLVPYSAIIRAPWKGDSQVAVIADKLKAGSLSGVRILADEKLPLAVGVRLVDSDVEVIDSEIAGAQTGVEIQGGARAILRANSIHDCVFSGVRISGQSTAWLSHNEISRNGRPAADRRPGLLVIDPARPVMMDNIFSDNGAEAVSIPAGMDGRAIVKLNFFLNGKPLGQTKPRAMASKEVR
jgi:PPM family protein phosphatase